MKPERWKILDEIVQSALELKAEERPAYLDKECRGDPVLRREVESLIGYQEDASSFLERPAIKDAAALMAETKVETLEGRTLSHYHLTRKIGEGGMGEVYLAEDRSLDRQVAIKFISVDAEDALARRRLVREARAAAKLDHANICSVYEVAEQEGLTFIVMEYAEGETLAERIARKPLKIREAIEIAAQVADGLAEAHSHGIIHRDIKPQNVLLTVRGRAKVLDFGLAKVVRREDVAGSEVGTKSLMSEQGMVAGTVPYMSPEQLRGEAADSRSDIFSFGVMLYEMITGRKAFSDKSQASLIAAILERDPEPVSAIQPTTPPALERLVKKCLAKERDKRWQSIADVADELRWIAEGGSQASAAADVVVRGRDRERLAWRIVAGVLLVGLLAALLFIVANFRRPAMGVTAMRFTIPPSEKQSIFDPSISPDGRRLIYAAPSEGMQQLWLRELDSLTAQPLPGTDKSLVTGEGLSPFWSPDSRHIAFFADGKLKRMEVPGGPAQTLADAPVQRGGSWSRDGVIVFCPSPTDPLYQVSEAGGEVSQLTTLDESRQEGSHRSPFFLPDGRHFLYLATSGQRENSAIYVGSLDSKETKRIISANSRAAYAPPGYLLFEREGTLMAQPFDADNLQVTGGAFPAVQRISDSSRSLAGFSVSNNGVLVYQTSNPATQLTWFDRSGKQLGTVGQSANYLYLRLSPDDKRLAVARNYPSSDIWLIDLGRGVPSRLTSDPGTKFLPIWSPDGSQIAFNSNRDGTISIYKKLSSGAGNEELLLKSPRPAYLADWSPDGRFILYHSPGEKTRLDIWVLPLFGERKPYLLVQTGFDEVQARCSPDGRWVAYVSDETGIEEVYVREFQGSGGRWQVSTGGGNLPRWRRDGKELFYISGRKLMAVDVKAEGSSFEAGVPKLLFGVIIAERFDVSGDGRKVLVGVLSSSDPITVVLNWTADLKR